ncbi:hypothetical protein MNBD_NITROSPINAE02-1666, partial [hydrothermal vent metagenome]
GLPILDKRRVKSVDEVFGDIKDADLEREPTFVGQLRQKADEDDKRLKEYIAAHKEKMTEMDNVRKRLEADVEKRANARFGELVRDLLPLIDDIDRAIDSATKSSDNALLLEGVRLLREGALEALKNKGLEEILCEGQPFDPEIAQAVATEVVSEDDKDNIVTAQLATGYKFAGMVLRPALVRVGQKTKVDND